MEKEKISFGRVLIFSLLFSIIVVFIFVVCEHIVSPHMGVTKIDLQDDRAQNSQFEAYFGDHVSATEVKQLLSLIRSNNITSQANGENKMIFVNGKYASTPTNVAGGIKSGSYYLVQAMNEKAVDPTTEDSTPIDADAPGGSKKDAGYYKNGFLRNIKIELIEKNNDTDTSSQNLDNDTINNNNL